MGLFKKVEDTKCGLKVLVFGDTGSGKTSFALTFPEICAIDSEAGMEFYKSNPNLKYILNTTSAEDVEEALDEIELELLNEIKTFCIDSETKIYENLQLSGLNIAEKRARQKGQSTDDAGISMREWGKIKLVTKRMQAVKIMFSSKGINVVSVAQQKEIKEKKGDNWVVVGYAPDTSKGFEYDYDIVIRLFTEKDKNSKEEIYKGEIYKDRTSTTKKGEIVENPSFEIWRNVYEGKSSLKENVINFKQDINKDESKMASELEMVETLRDKFKKGMKSLDSKGQTTIAKKCKELEIDNPLKTDNIEALKELNDLIKALS